MRTLALAGLCVGALVGVSVPATAAEPVPSFRDEPSGEAPCPEGSARSSTVAEASFETRFPEPDFTEGWYTIGTSAPDGSRVARSLLGGSSADPVDYFYLEPMRASGPTYLAFASRGSQAASKAIVSVNSFGRSVPATSTWSGTVHDITSATTDENGWLTTWFEHRYVAGSERTWDLDNVQVFTCRDAATNRIEGADRYAVSAAIADTFTPGLETVFVARGDNFPDALAAVPVAARSGSPIVLVRPDEIPSTVRASLTRLKPQRIVVLGGPDSVTPPLVRELEALATTGTVTRIAGPDRYVVSAGLSSQSFPDGADHAIVVSGEVFPDALSAAPLASGTPADPATSPMLLVRGSRIPGPIATELERLGPSRITIVGGPATVSNGVAGELASLTGASVTRISGSDRYEVSATVAGKFGPSGIDNSYLATGADFPDSILGAALAGAAEEPLLLTRGSALPSEIRERLEWLRESTGTVVGGPASVAAIVRDQYGRTLP